MASRTNSTSQSGVQQKEVASASCSCATPNQSDDVAARVQQNEKALVENRSSPYYHLQIETSTAGDLSDSEDDDDDTSDDENRKKATYIGLIRSNKPYRLFLASYIVARAGDWFNYVACIAAIEEILGPRSESSMTAVSLLVIIRLLPYVLFSSVGGVLADSKDRRKCMIILDCLGSMVVLLYLAACRIKSIPLIYLIAFVQESIAALYEPNNTAIVPLLVKNEDFLKKAMTLSNLAWSLMAAVGASLGGFAVSVLGFEACFVIDSVSFLSGAVIMWQIGGTWTVVDAKEGKQRTSLWKNFTEMTVEGVKYLLASPFGIYIFLKPSASIIFGSTDVLIAAFSQEYGHDEGGKSELLGFLFASVGVGCLFGPLIADTLTDMKNPQSLLLACMYSLALMSLSLLGMGFFAPFSILCLFNAIRAAGSAVAWVDSTLILQKYSAPEMLGRVTAVEYSLSMMCEAGSALLAGWLFDGVGLSAKGVSLVMAVLGVIFTLMWLPHFLRKSSSRRFEAAAKKAEGYAKDEGEKEARNPSEKDPLLA